MFFMFSCFWFFCFHRTFMHKRVHNNVTMTMTSRGATVVGTARFMMVLLMWSSLVTLVDRGLGISALSVSRTVRSHSTSQSNTSSVSISPSKHSATQSASQTRSSHSISLSASTSNRSMSHMPTISASTSHSFTASISAIAVFNCTHYIDPASCRDQPCLWLADRRQCVSCTTRAADTCPPYFCTDAFRMNPDTSPAMPATLGAALAANASGCVSAYWYCHQQTNATCNSWAPTNCFFDFMSNVCRWCGELNSSTCSDAQRCRWEATTQRCERGETPTLPSPSMSSSSSPSLQMTTTPTNTRSHSLTFSPSVSSSATTSHTVQFNCSNYQDFISCTRNVTENCGWDLEISQCSSCTNSTQCAGGCFLSAWTATCVTKGAPCRIHPNQSACLLKSYQDQPCIWLQTGNEYSCTSCAAFEKSLAPCPKYNCYQPSNVDLTCVSYSIFCPALSNDTCETQSSNCFWDSDSDSCVWCGDFYNHTSCGAAFGCVWNSGLARCERGSSLTLERAVERTQTVAVDTTTPAPTTPVVVPQTTVPTSLDTAFVVGVSVAVGGGLFLLGVLIAARYCWTHRKLMEKHRFLGGGIFRGEMVEHTERSTVLSNNGGRHDDDGLMSVMDPNHHGAIGMSEAEKRRVAKLVRLIRKRRFRQTKLIGRGAHGSVYHCVLDNGTILAVKEILFTPSSHEELDVVMQEVGMVSSLRHPNIVQYYTSLYEPIDMRFSIFMELMSNGSLGDLVRGSRSPLPDSLARHYAKQICSALAFIHSHGIVHRDLKCDNLLLTQDGSLKLCDFGAAKHIGIHNSIGAQTMVGTPFFMAPEILGAQDVLDAASEQGAAARHNNQLSMSNNDINSSHRTSDTPRSGVASGGSIVRVSRHGGGGCEEEGRDETIKDEPSAVATTGQRERSQLGLSGEAGGDKAPCSQPSSDPKVDEARYGKRCDVWSFGITLLEMMNCGIAPWPVQSIGATMLYIASPHGKPIFPPHLTPLARSFIECCVVRDPKKRLTSAELLTHPWLTSAAQLDDDEGAAFRMDDDNEGGGDDDERMETTTFAGVSAEAPHTDSLEEERREQTMSSDRSSSSPSGTAAHLNTTSRMHRRSERAPMETRISVDMM